MQIYRCPLRYGGLNTTIGSGSGPILELSPTMNMVLRHKGRITPVLSDVGYTELYLPIMHHAFSGWRELRNAGSNNQVMISCYCGQGKFCHTLLIGLYASLRWSLLFEDKTGSREILSPEVVELVEAFVKEHY